MSRGHQQAKSEATRQRALDAALQLFSQQGFRATTIRQIAETADLSVGNVYYHFPSKEAIFERLLEDFSHRIFDSDSPFSRIFEPLDFPADLEILATTCDELVTQNLSYFLLIYVDVVEFQGEHIRNFYLDTAARYRQRYEADDEDPEAVDPGFAMTFAVRWLVYYSIVEKCFGVGEHMGIPTPQAHAELFKLIRKGLS
ncbi:MAG: TetR/AcrR family transcriptional regulator [Thermoanaerobaculia bacterium]|nr:TetR/AcrR family transcriptional regulator [Thermoanaerobaculia bacterium]